MTKEDFENPYKNLISAAMEDGSFDQCTNEIVEQTGIDIEIVDELTLEIIDQIREAIVKCVNDFYPKYFR